MPQRPYRVRRDRTNEGRRWPRAETIRAVEALQFNAEHDGTSEREFAQWHGIPRSTLRQWRTRSDRSLQGHSPFVVSFFESSEGLVLLHRLVVAAQFSFVEVGGCGIRVLCTFLELCGLDAFVASSYGPQQEAMARMERALVNFGAQERTRLAPTMEPQKITVCQDETFHPEICLVAMEPVSNFLLLERYAQRRDAKTWNEAMDKALEGLPVESIQSTSDEASGLLRHAREHLQAHHSPDVFHAMQDTSRATSGPMAAKVRKAEQAADKADKAHGPCSPQAQANRATVEHHKRLKDQMRDTRKAISQAYHPFDLETGKIRSPELLEGYLRGSFFRLFELAGEAGLSSLKGLHKAFRLVPQMVATLAFFHQQARLRIEALALGSDLEALLRDHWLPGVYLQLAANKASRAKERQQLRERSRALLAPVHARDGPLQGLDPQRLRQLQQTVMEIAQLFQRSSSCVEGRNGQLSLRHHGRHRFSKTSLGALTVVHNFFLRRPDGSTAAQRFFGQSHRDLFAFLLDSLEPPRRPARPRSPRRLAMAA